MRRPVVHRAFAVIVACLLGLSLWQGWKLYQHGRLVASIDAVPASLAEEPNDAAATPSSVVLLSRANALSNGGQFEAAERLYVKLVDADGDRYEALGNAARLNLANHYLRHGSDSSLPAGATLPFLGMAKQRYRDLLRIDPTDWDARHNLERALTLAPEGGDDPLADKQVHQRANVVVPDFEQLDLP